MPLEYYLLLSAILFSIGAYGVISKRNAIRMLMSIEIMLNSANINLVAFSSYNTPFSLTGQVFVTFTISVAAAEAAVGLAIFIGIYRAYKDIDLEKIATLKW
ncbi:MAG: NADH-quinone oxidoreductase subunit NuoK [Euryarchaeota archaeon]|nr:NADH-quinone oxidoreductase subunit NuoK [Euryarchaeota archaeon]